MLQIICFQNIIYRLLSLESLIGPSYSFMITRRSKKQSKKLGSSVHAVKVCTDEEFPSEFLRKLLSELFGGVGLITPLSLQKQVGWPKVWHRWVRV